MFHWEPLGPGSTSHSMFVDHSSHSSPKDSAGVGWERHENDEDFTQLSGAQSSRAFVPCAGTVLMCSDQKASVLLTESLLTAHKKSY